MQLFAGELTNQNRKYYEVNDNIIYLQQSNILCTTFCLVFTCDEVRFMINIYFFTSLFFLYFGKVKEFREIWQYIFFLTYR